MHKILIEDVYGAQVIFVANEPFEVVNKLIKKGWPKAKLHDPININFVASAGYVHGEKEGQVIGYFLWISNFDWTVDNQGTVVHEIWHLVNRILADRGLFEDAGKDEAYAYYIGYWFERIWNLLKPTHSNVKRQRTKRLNRKRRKK